MRNGWKQGSLLGLADELGGGPGLLACQSIKR